MINNVVKMYPANSAEKADNVIEQAIGKFGQVLIIGWDNDGNLDARATVGLSDGGDMLWLIESFKTKLMNGDYVGDE